MDIHNKPGNLVELFEMSLACNADRPLFGTADQTGVYNWTTYTEVANRTDNLRGGMAQRGIKKGDSVGIIANNREEWAIAAFAAFGLEAMFVPMYEKELPHIWKHIINDSSVKILFVANEDILSAVEQFRDDCPQLEQVYLIDGTKIATINDLELQGKKLPQDAIHPAPGDIAVLIYTSGTTGSPKGVLLSHNNFVSNVLAGSIMYPEFNNNYRSLSILPWAHSYGLTAELFNFINMGGSMGFIRNVNTIVEDMYNVAPTFLIAVPRVFNKIYDGLWSKMNETGGLALKLFTLGLESAKQLRQLASEGKPALVLKLQLKLADLIVFSKIRKRFGGNLTGALTASAMMNIEVAQFFTDIGIPVFDAYGLTETSPAVTMNNRKDNRPGSVGRPIDKVQVVIDRLATHEAGNEGEIVVYGPNVMHGYHNKPEATFEVMTENGGFRTGDLGYLDEDGFLFVTGRIKEQYKLENGKYVFPVSLEEEIQMSPWVENVLIYGEGRSHNICLIVPNFHNLSNWARQQGIDCQSHHELIKSTEVKTMVNESILHHLQGKFGGYEMPREILLIEEPFSVDNGMLTQTMKLKRKKVLEHYGEQVDLAYSTRR